jgi:hypothetical protein
MLDKQATKKKKIKLHGGYKEHGNMVSSRNANARRKSACNLMDNDTFSK